MALTGIIKDNKLFIPQAVLTSAGLENGSKISFRIDGSKIIIENANIAAFTELQNLMLGAAEQAGFKNENELQDYLLSIRHELRGY